MKLGMPQLYEYERAEESLALAKELELDFVELNLNFGSLREELEGGNLKELFDKYNLEATMHFFDEADFGTYDEVADAYLSLLERYALCCKGFVRIMNIHLISGPVVTISGVKNFIYDKEFEAYSKRLVKNLKRAEKICRDNGIEMVLENTDHLAKFMKRTYEVLKEEGFQFNYDVGHDRVDGDYILNNVIPELNLNFKEFHIHDSDGKACHLALGEGSMDMKKYKELAKDAYVVLEVKQSEDVYKSVPVFRAL